MAISIFRLKGEQTLATEVYLKTMSGKKSERWVFPQIHARNPATSAMTAEKESAGMEPLGMGGDCSNKGDDGGESKVEIDITWLTSTIDQEQTQNQGVPRWCIFQR